MFNPYRSSVSAGKSLVALLLLSLGLLSLLLVNFGTASPISQAASTQTLLSVGDSNWVSLNGIPNANTFNDVDCPSTTVCYVVGDGGTILTTYDGGTTWQSTPYVDKDDFLAIDCPGLTLCYATTRTGKIYKYDGGIGWGSFTAGFWSLQYSTQPQRQLDDISCFNTTTCVAVGFEAITVRTNDGKNWTGAVTNGGGAPIKHLLSVTCPTANICYAVGWLDTVLLSANGGATWGIQSISVATDENWVSVSCPSSTTCYAVSENGKVFANTPNGATDWTLRGSVPDANPKVATINCPSVDVCYIGSGVEKSYIYKNSNSQMSAWTKQVYNLGRRLTGLSCPDNNTCMQVADAKIATTTNGGTNWLKRTTEMDMQLRDVACPSATICYFVGGDNKVYKTSTRGLDFQVLETPLEPLEELYSISCPSVQVCYAVGTDPSGIVTTNGGQSWSKLVNSGAGYYLYGVFCRSTTHCLAVGANGTLFELNASSQWESRNSTVTKILKGVTCASANVCYAVGEAGVLLTSNNGGATWNPEAIGVTYSLNDIACPSTTNCYISGANGILRKIGGANTWTEVDPGGTGFRGLSCSDATTCYVVNSIREVYSTNNGGNTWTKDTAGTNNSSYSYTIACPAGICLVVGRGAIIASAVPVFVSNDNGNGLTVGTLSHALARVTDNQKQRIQITTNSVQLTGSSPLPNLKRTTILEGKCGANGPQVTINAPDNASISGLLLEGRNTVSGVKLDGFRGPVIKVGTSYTDNKLSCVKAISK
jgi:photosystem II stability/assembly factor-like uncharacterized protein